ncbi:MAG: diacylglycerol kinase [Thermodesulfobacteriota bacterium]|nr:MAG: diacylglycerol kinase [Thermodesulfobacteriota bacterium]
MMGNEGDIIKPKGWLGSLNCAIEGIIYAFKTQKHIKIHYLLAVAALVLSLLFKLPVIEFVLFAFSIIILLFAEMLNTAIEEAVNLIEDKHNKIAKNTKDISAGAVLIASIGVAIMVYMIFTEHLNEPAAQVLGRMEDFAGHIAVISLLLVLIAVVVIKAISGKGRPLHGGMPSGHAAVAYSLFTSITIITLNPLVSILAFVMALMVSHSRLLGGIHSRLEVFLGALLGFGLTLLLYQGFIYL